MERFYEVFFDGEDINRFWGTAETKLGDDMYELCAQPYYVRLGDMEAKWLNDNLGEGTVDDNGIATRRCTCC